MNTDPLKLLDMVYHRGEFACLQASDHDKARKAASELSDWIKSKMKETYADDALKTPKDKVADQ